MNKNKIIKGLIIFALLLIILMQNVISYAEPVTVTKENLTEAFAKMKKFKGNKEGFNIKCDDIIVLDEEIIFKVDNKEYKLKYDISGQPIFTYEIDINQGMKYKDFGEEIAVSTMVMLGYMAVANIQGVEFEDSLINMLQTVFKEAFDSSNTNALYKIQLDESKTDDNSEDVYEILTEGIDSKEIKEAEFPNKVIEFVDYVYLDKTQITDSKEIGSYATFAFVTKKETTSETSRKITTTLIVNLTADFEKLKNVTQDLENSLGNTENTIGGQISNSIENQVNNNNINQNSNKVLQKYPYAGLETNILVPILSCAIGLLAIFLLTMLAKIKKLEKE